MASPPEEIEVDLSCAHVQSPVRLMELPPALLSLLATDPAPALKIKAAPPVTGSEAPSSTAHHAVLCTPSQTFSLRHVHSSNSTFLLAPSTAPTAPGVTAVSTATSYLELVATTPDSTALLQKHLNPYHGWSTEDSDGDIAMLNNTSANTSTPDTVGTSKHKILEDLPMSDKEFENAWRQMMAFEHRHTLYRPVPSAVLRVLDAVLLAAAAEKIPLTTPFEVVSMSSAVAEDQPELPPGLLYAVMGQMCDDSPSTGQLVLNPPRCAEFVGKCILEDYWQQQQVKKNLHDLLYIAFMSRWKAKVPDACVPLCKLDLLKGWYRLPTPNTITFVPGGAATDAPKAAGASEPSAPAKNKWHERLGKGKKR